MNKKIIPLEPISIFVYDSIYVSECLIIGLIINRLTTWKLDIKNSETIVSIAEYRNILGDTTSTDKQITKRLQYLEAFCKNIIKPELQTYVQHYKK